MIFIIIAIIAVLVLWGVTTYNGLVKSRMQTKESVSYTHLLQYGSPWWTWVLVSGLIGLSIGLVAKKIKIEKGQLTEKDLVWFNSAQILANVIGWGIIAPYGDILVYSEPASKVFTQGILSAAINRCV